MKLRFLATLLYPLTKKRMSKEPDFIIGVGDTAYLKRWYVFPENKLFNIYLHEFLRDDYDNAMHDHPFDNISIILWGEYNEFLPGGVRYRSIGSIVLRRAETPHRIEVESLPAERAITIFIRGPRRRTWGFYCPWGWRPWYKFVKITSAGNSIIGAGCE